jgi:hypothetical protein
MFADRRRRRSRAWYLVPVVILVVAAAAVMKEKPWSSSGHDPLSSAQRVASTATARRHTTTAAPKPRHTPRVLDPFARKTLRSWLAARSGNITAAVYDEHDHRTWVYRPGHPEHTASIVKVDILATLLHQDQSDGGISQADQETATGMIEESDDDDATDLWNDEGGAPAVQSFDDAVGMHATTANVAWGLTTTTPSDQLTLLKTVTSPNPLLSTDSRDYELDLMHHISAYDTWGVTAGVPKTAEVAFKNGWLPYQGSWQVNSIGDVQGDGRHYLIAVMTDGSATEGYGITTISRISKTTWSSLAPRHG